MGHNPKPEQDSPVTRLQPRCFAARVFGLASAAGNLSTTPANATIVLFITSLESDVRADVATHGRAAIRGRWGECQVLFGIKKTKPKANFKELILP
jgi:hypothetical protein